jgi:hypothetical protein
MQILACQRSEDSPKHEAVLSCALQYNEFIAALTSNVVAPVLDTDATSDAAAGPEAQDHSAGATARRRSLRGMNTVLRALPEERDFGIARGERAGPDLNAVQDDADAQQDRNQTVVAFDDNQGDDSTLLVRRGLIV